MSILDLEPLALWDIRDTESLAQNSAGTTALTAPGDPVGRVADLSGNGNHASTSTNNQRPIYRVEDDGVACIEFDGSNNQLLIPGLDTLMDERNVWWAAFAVKNHSLSGPGFSLLGKFNSTSPRTSTHFWLGHDEDGDWPIVERVLSGSFADTWVVTGKDDGSRVVVAGWYSGSQRGVQVPPASAQTNGDTRDMGTGNATPMHIGGVQVTGMVARLYAGIVFDRVPDGGEQDEILSWLQSRVEPAAEAEGALTVTLGDLDLSATAVPSASATVNETLGPLVVAGAATVADPVPDWQRDWFITQKAWAQTDGGNGGTIIRVTNLNASGAGSLKAALDASGKRTVVFEVSGVIDMGGAKWTVNNGQATVAGQTAPSPGIALIKGMLEIAAPDVIVSHLFIGCGVNGGSGQDCAETVGGANRVILDHCAFFWGRDGNIDLAGYPWSGSTITQYRNNTSRNVTMTACVIAESFGSGGCLLHDNSTGLFLARNYFYACRGRNGHYKGGVHGISANNLIYNPQDKFFDYTLQRSQWTSNGGGAWIDDADGQVDLIGNVCQAGPSTNANALFELVSEGDIDLYLSDNVAKRTNGNDYPQAVISNFFGETSGTINHSEVPRHPGHGESLMPSEDVVDWVRDNVGPRPWDRMAHVQRVLDHFTAGTGEHISNQSSAGGYPVLAQNAKEFDPNEWDLSTMIPLSEPDSVTTGSLGATLGPALLASSAESGIAAALTSTLGPATVSASAKSDVNAEADIVLGALTVAAAAGIRATGELATTLGPASLSATAESPIAATVESILGALDAVSAGESGVAGALVSTLGNLSLYARSGAPGTDAAASISLGALTCSAQGGAAVGGALDGALAPLGITAAGVAHVSAVLGVELGQIEVQSTAAGPPPPQVGPYRAYLRAATRGADVRRIA